jgi:hypothetical protein
MPLLTIRDVRRLIADLPDQAPVLPDWAEGPPQDHEPGVEIVGIAIADRGAGPHLSMKVRLFYLEEEENHTENET